MNKEEEKTSTIETMISIILAFIIGIIIIGITFMILIVNANAENEIQSLPLGYNEERSSGASREVDIYTNTNTLVNWGRGTLLFNLITFRNDSTNVAFDVPIVQEVEVSSGNDLYICNVGSVSNNYSNDYETFKSNIYSVICDVNLGSSGITKIHVTINNTVYNKYWLKSSNYMTFSKNLDISTINHIDQVNSTLASYLQSIYNNISQTNTTLNSINTMLNTDLNSIITLITCQNQKLDNIQDKIEEMIESQRVCEDTIIDKNDIEEDNKSLNPDGTITNNNNRGITRYIDIHNTTKIEIIESTLQYYCFYTNNKTLIECRNSGQTGEIQKPNNTYYFRTTISKTYNIPKFKITICKNGNQAVVDYGEDVEPDEPSQNIQDIEEEENQLLEDLEEIDLSDQIDIDLDQNSNEWVWNQITNAVQTNAKVFGMIISVLVLGIIKTILGR